MATITETTLEINLQSLAHNYRYFRSQLAENTKFMGVVKASAYGSDSVSIAKKLVDLGVDYLGVAYIKEGITLRQNGIKKPILVFYPQIGNFKDLITHQLTPAIYSKKTFLAFKSVLLTLYKRTYPIHLNFNTGMNRFGFNVLEIDWILRELEQLPYLKIEGIFSHLAASEDENEHQFGVKQIEKFKAVCQKITPRLPEKPLRHICNTSGILNFKTAHFDMVRSGIGLYGYGNAEKFDQHLIPIGTLKTLIAQIRTIRKGESVGYNRVFRAAESRKIATLPLGYADGLNHAYSQGVGQVLINGKTASIIGNVCMDTLMVDVTHIDCQEGDEVLIFGPQKSADAMAYQVGTISYELITTISQRVRRILIS